VQEFKERACKMGAIIRLENIVKKFYIGEPNELEILHGISLRLKRVSSYPLWDHLDRANLLL